MLEGYFGVRTTEEQKQRLLAVQAALEVAKASAASSAGTGGSMYSDLTEATTHVVKLADAIQEALKG